MRYNDIELTVLIKGRPITEYPHNGQVFVEGRDRSEFSLRVTNHNRYRVEAVISVDGLSVVDGKDAGPQSSGYVLNAGESANIPGWKLNDAQVAAFVFGGKGESYAAVGPSGSARNTGVIGVMAFQERVQHRYDRPVFAFGQVSTFAPVNGYNGTSDASYQSLLQSAQICGVPNGLEVYGSGSIMSGGPSNMDWLSQEQERSVFQPMGMTSVNAVSPTSSAMATSYNAADSMGGSRGVMRGMADGGSRSRGKTKCAEPVAQARVQQNLGTGFGRATEFATATVDFQRGDMRAMIVLYYDDARGLRSRGIEIDRRARQPRNQTPNAFPGMSCTPPVGWKG